MLAIALDLNRNDLRLSQDLPNHDMLNPDIDLSFSVHLVGVTLIWCLHLLLFIKIKVYIFILLLTKSCVRKYRKRTDLIFVRKTK